MIILSTLSLLISNAVSLRRDMSILYNRIAIIALLYAILQSLISFSIISNGGIGIHGGLFHVTNITQVFHIFLYSISILILQLTSFYPRKVWVAEHSSLKDLFLNKFVYYRTKIINKMGEHLKIIEYPLILLFIISGAVFLMSTNDFISIFLSIELQSYGLYLLSTIYRNSELSTTGGLIYFLLGGLSSCFILLGTSLLYANSGTTNMDSLYVITSISDLNNYGNSWYNDDYINFSLLIFTIGFLFKVSAAPFHFWSPAERCGKSLFRVKLSNSGDTLELMIPSYNWKVISGWTNYSCMVTSHKNPEKEVGNRGSKSDIIGLTATSLHTLSPLGGNWSKGSVKEQRVYDNWRAVFSPRLRCILPGFERNRIIKIPSKQIIQTQLYSTASKGRPLNIISNTTIHLSGGSASSEFKLSPWFVTGFADAEGCFMLTIRKDLRQASGWRVEANFVINLHKRDVELLKLIQTYFGGVGRISKERNGCIDYTVSSINQILTQVIPHFDKYPLITQKNADYLLFKEVVMIMKQGEHLTVSGIQAIINIRATLNKGLTPLLMEAFPSTVAVPRPQVNNIDVQSIDPYWVAGFTSGDGTFIVSIRDSKSSQTDGRVSLTFALIQHSRDEFLMKSLVDYFGFGKAYTYKNYTEFKSRSLEDNFEKVIPFFKNYPILGVKSLDFADWCKVATFINNKAHLTKEGFKSIREIKAGMNKSRIKDS